MSTNFPPGLNDPIKEFLQSGEELENIKDLDGLLSKLSYIIFILNPQQEIVFSNQNLLSRFNILNKQNILGERPGEILACVHSNKGPDGCGSTKFCRYCGVVNTILDTKNINNPYTREASITVTNNGIQQQLDLEITATPFFYSNKKYIVYSARDITDKKRKEILERTFFHDIINMAGSLDGIMELMEEMSCHEKDRMLVSAKRISNSLIDEIMAQYQISKAEHNELKVNLEKHRLVPLVQDSLENIRHHHVASKKHLKYIRPDSDADVITDKVLFNRILVNMLKNALEASHNNETVTLSVHKTKTGHRVDVHNNRFMHSNIQNQIFNRSFSTKGSGRGIGTYSMKLLGERYLKGKISFKSEPDKGTVFSFEFADPTDS